MRPGRRTQKRAQFLKRFPSLEHLEGRQLMAGLNDPSPSETPEAINVAPVVTQNYTQPVSYTRDAEPVLILPGANSGPLGLVYDPDSSDFAGGSLLVRTTRGAHSGDRIVPRGEFWIQGSSLLHGSITIGTVVKSGIGGADFSITFNANATAARVEKLANSLGFATVGGRIGSRSLAFTITDGDGGTSNTLTRTVLVWPSASVLSYDGIQHIDFPAVSFDFGASLNLSNVDGIGFDVFNDSDFVARIGVKFQSANGASHVLLQNILPHSHVRLGASFLTALKVYGLPFTESDVKGMTSQLANADLSNIARLQFFLDRPSEATTVTISNVRALEHIPLDTPLIDKYGQYTRAEWEGKAHNDAELAQLIQEDIARTQALQPEANRDAYGGMTNSGIDFGGSIPPGGTGHFTTAKDTSGRWWFVTPAGNPFYHVGINSAQPYGGSPVDWRPQLFEPVSPLSEQGGYDYYAANIDRYNEVAGPGASWEARTINRLLGWGFNSLGNWPVGTLTESVPGAPRIPYMRTVLQERLRLMPQTRFDGGPLDPVLNFPGTDYPISVFYTDSGRYAFPDVFSQAFIDYTTKATVTGPSGTIPGFFGTPEVARTNNDPYAIGFFVDNEIRWAGGEHEERMAIPRSALNMTGSVLRTRFLQELAGKYSSAAALMSAWNVTFTGLADPNTPLPQIGNALFVYANDLNATAQADMSELLGIYAEQYYSTVNQGFRTFLPNKLYLGSRLYEGDAALPVLQAMGRYADVISLNLYRKPEEIASFDWAPLASLNKPLLIGEFGYVGIDQGHFTGFHYDRDTATQADRGALYQQYMTLIANNPLFVGASIFSYGDEVASGRGGNYENLNTGLINILDLPHQDFVDRIAAWNHSKFETRLGTAVPNSAPVLNIAATPNLNSIVEDQINSFGTTVRSLLAGVSDADDLAERGIAVTSLTGSANGTWQYTLDGGKVWFDFGAVSASSARLLPDSAEFSRIRFKPNKDFQGTVRLSFAAWDQTQGYHGLTYDLSGAGTSGGSTAFSANRAAVDLNITAVNDAPRFEETGGAIARINATDLGSVGFPVSQLATGITDVDGGSQKGVAITSLSGNGTWQFTLDGGVTWVDLGPVSITQARLLPDDSSLVRIRFQRNGNFIGTIQIGYYAWDQTEGTAGETIDISDANDRGRTSAFSIDRRTSSVMVNNAPELDAEVVVSPPSVVKGNTNPYGFGVWQLLAGSSDDSNTRGVVVTSLTGKINGAWQYTLDRGVTWLDLETVTQSAARLLKADGENSRLRFVPNATFTGTAQLSYRAWDLTQGTVGETFDLSGSGKIGTSTAFSATSRNSTLSVTPPNQAPVLDPAQTPSLGTIVEDTAANSINGRDVASLLGGVTDLDGTAPRGLAVVGVTAASNGVWQYSLNSGTSWLPLGTPSDAAARVLGPFNRVRFVPNANFDGEASLIFRAWDASDSLPVGSRVNLTASLGGRFAYSTATDAATVDITPVNDAPVLSVTTPSLPEIAEDAVNNAGAAVSSLLGGASDLDGPAQGIAVYAVGGKIHGTWQFSLDGGATWSPLGDPQESASVLLAPSNRIRYVPNANFSGSAQLFFRAWDQSNGLAPGSIVSTVGLKGGKNPYSVQGDAATVVISAVNDAPTLSSGTNPVLDAIPEDTTNPAGTLVSSFAGPRIKDVDANAIQGIAVVGLTEKTRGRWQYSLDDGTTWLELGSPSETSARLLRPVDRVRFVPNANYSGTPQLKFRAWDRTDGAAPGSVADASDNGGWKAFSAAALSARLSVTPVNDPAVLTLSGTTSYVFNSAAVILTPNATIYDIDTSMPGGELRVRVAAGASASNRLEIGGNFTVDASTGQVKLGTTVIGTRTSSGVGTADLVISLGSAATKATVQQLLRSITFRTSVRSPGQRQIAYQFVDRFDVASAERIKKVNVN